MEGRNLGDPAGALSCETYSGVASCWREVFGSGIDEKKSGLGGRAVIERAMVGGVTKSRQQNKKGASTSNMSARMFHSDTSL